MPGRILIWYFCLTMFLFFSPFVADAADNLLSNSDFEDWDGSGPIGWQKSAASGFSVEPSFASGTVKTGSLSALLKLTTGNYRYIYQTASVSGSTAYRFSGSIKNIFGTSSALLRLAWYCLGCTSQLPGTDDSSVVDQAIANFTDLSVEVVSPTNAAQVKARVVITPASGSTDNRIIVDNLSLTTVSNSTQNTLTTSPTINWNTGSAYDLGEIFSLHLKLENFDPSQGYYLKFRAGTDENALNKGQTKSGSAFYADNESWSKFPQVTTDASGKWEGQISGRVGEDKTVGQYTIRIRVRRQDTDTFSDSDPKTVSFASPPIAGTGAVTTSVVAPLAKTTVATSSPKLATDSAEILGTQSGFPGSSGSGQPNSVEKKLPVSTPQNNPWVQISLIVGFLLSAGAAGLFVVRKIQSRGI